MIFTTFSYRVFKMYTQLLPSEHVFFFFKLFDTSFLYTPYRILSLCVSISEKSTFLDSLKHSWAIMFSQLWFPNKELEHLKYVKCKNSYVEFPIVANIFKDVGRFFWKRKFLFGLVKKNMVLNFTSFWGRVKRRAHYKTC